MGKKRVAQKGDAGIAKKTSGSVSGARGKKKAIKKFDEGRIYIRSSYNNTTITITDDKGNVIAWATAGGLGFSGPKKATPYAASKVVASIVEKIDKTGPKKVHVYVSGIGPGRDSSIRTLAGSGFDILSIYDITPIPFNGPRARKERRV